MLSELPRPGRRPDRSRDRQCAGLRGGAPARRAARRARPGQDHLLLQRQSRVPHAADADAGPDGGCARASRDRAARHPRRGCELAHRNGLRLLKLVNSLLDFSRIEAGRVEATSSRSTCRRSPPSWRAISAPRSSAAGLRLTIDCPPLPQPVYVDRDMWEKIVLNLLSNAFKFTFEGRSRSSPGCARAMSRCSRCATPAWASRKTRCRAVSSGSIGSKARSGPHVRRHRHRACAGAGAGQAAWRDRSRSRARVGRGTTLHRHGPVRARRIFRRSASARAHVAQPTVAAREAYVEEALRWLPEVRRTDDAVDGRRCSDAPRRCQRHRRRTAAQRLVADDNADMRDYVCRLLGPVH